MLESKMMKESWPSEHEGKYKVQPLQKHLNDSILGFLLLPVFIQLSEKM